MCSFSLLNTYFRLGIRLILAWLQEVDNHPSSLQILEKHWIQIGSISHYATWLIAHTLYSAKQDPKSAKKNLFWLDEGLGCARIYIPASKSPKQIMRVHYWTTLFIYKAQTKDWPANLKHFDFLVAQLKDGNRDEILYVYNSNVPRPLLIWFILSRFWYIYSIKLLYLFVDSITIRVSTQRLSSTHRKCIKNFG